MRRILQIAYGVLFLTGFAGGYFAGEMAKHVLYDFYLLAGYAALGTLLGSFVTPFFLELTYHHNRWIKYIKEIGSHFLLNISVIGANGLFLFLWINQMGSQSCTPVTKDVMAFTNQESKKKYTTEKNALVWIEWNGKPTPIYFEDPLTKVPKQLHVCIKKGVLGIDVIIKKTIVYQ